MATRSVPTVDGTPTYQSVALHYVDASGDTRSVSLRTAEGVDVADIEAMVAAIQVATNASIYRVDVNQVYNSIPNVGNATNATYPSVFDNVVVLFKTPEGFSQNGFIPAPDASIMPADSDTPIVAAVNTIAAAMIAVMEGDGTPPVGWEAVSTRFTERREKNQRVFFGT